MILNDYHLHSSFSGDCDVDMEVTLEKAISLGMQNICFTDHHDLDFPYEGVCFELNVSEYVAYLLKLKEVYKDRINVRLGIELGVQSHLYDTMNTLVDQYPFDFVLCSSHLVNRLDPYDKGFFEGKTKKQAYDEYFLYILEQVKNYTAYDSYAHLDYVIRYGPYEDKIYNYMDHQDILDEVLKTIIKNGKGIEINTSGFFRFDNPHPRIDVLKRYKELGGEIITVGSDAHLSENLLYKFDKAEEILKSIGFNYYTIFIDRKANFIKL